MKRFAKLLGLLLFVSTLLIVRPITIKAQEKLLVTKAGTVVSDSLPVNKSDPTASICPTQIKDAIDGVINRPQFRHSRWGILIESLSLNSKLPPQTLYSHDAQKYFIPASNVKLLITAAVLHHLGTEFRIRTSVYGTGARSLNDTNLYVVGRGDPSLTDPQLRQLAQQLKRRGISQIQQLIAVDDYFKGPVVNPSWELADVQAAYGAPASSLILNQNAATLMLSPQGLDQPLKVSWADPLAATQWLVENSSVTGAAASPPSIEIIGSLGKPVLQIQGVLPVGAQPESRAIAVLDPARLFLQHFQHALAIEGITIAQARVASSPQIPAQELAFVESPSLAHLLIETNQNSNNLYAEALLRVLGTAKAFPTKSLQNSAELGLATVRMTLTELGIDQESYILTDGSGLSRHDLASPEAFVQTLRAIAQTPEAEVYRASLSVAGKSGTLQNRFRNTSAEGILQGKTGSLSGISALSGYLTPASYPPLVFSILVNQSDQPATSLRQAIDEIALLMTRLHQC